jgi:hypothetical protein
MAAYKPAPAPPPRPKKGKPKGKSKIKGNLKTIDTAALDASDAFKVPEDNTEAEESKDLQAPTSGPSKGRRSTVALPGQLDAPAVVEDVDNQQSFKFFNAGWILPATQKRGGRAAVDRGRVASPTPLKRPKTGMNLAR